MTDAEQADVGGHTAGVRRPRRLHARARRVLQQLRDRVGGYRDGWVKTSELRGSDRQALWHTLKHLEEAARIEKLPDPMRRGHYQYRITRVGEDALAAHEARTP